LRQEDLDGPEARMAIMQGDRFKLTRDFRGHGAALFGDGSDEDFACVIPVDAVLVAMSDVDPMAAGFMCGLESGEVLDAVVPRALRRREDFTGCRFVFYTGDQGALLEAL
jgi:hypothetical protein